LRLPYCAIDLRAIANIGEYFSPAVPHLCRYWLEKSAGRARPSRQEIDALDMPKRSLPYVMLVDIERAPFRVKYRLVGTGIASLFSLDFGGRYLDQFLMPGTYRQEAQALYQGVAETAEPVVGHYGYALGSTQQVVWIREWQTRNDDMGDSAGKVKSGDGTATDHAAGYEIQATKRASYCLNHLLCSLWAIGAMLMRRSKP
jgi:hypothetical protein